MSAPILLAAGGYEILLLIAMPGTQAFLPFLAVGFLTAAVVGWFSLKWLLTFLNDHSLYSFALYCFIVGSLVLLSQVF
jgi:undecaprenyl-diphosphatase